jgi:glycosyltransferase involved in cell wall biosynthesis
MENKILVSVVVPVYNCERLLKRCLESLVNQTLKDIEIICINDGSTDSSLKILQEFQEKDDRIILIDKSNEGQSKARNIGIDLAKGEFIAFVDADDWVDLYFYENLYNCANWYNADVAVGGIVRLNIFYKKYYLKFDFLSLTNDTREKFELCDVPKKSYVWNKIYRTDKLRQSKVRFEEGIIYEDVIFTPEILCALKTLVTVPEVYYYYWRRMGSSVTLRSEKANNDSVYAHNKAKKFFIENNIDI